MNTFREITTWQKAMAFVTKIYKITRLFPDDEKFGLVSQMRRCAVSIPSNIAEGYGKGANNDFKRFLRISYGSLLELQTQLEIAKDIEMINAEQFAELYEDSREIERMLTAFIDSLK
ncbi:MAG: four helix bundle protein [Mangrovibacterium sp.]